MVGESIKNFRLPERIVTPWLEALRSGGYVQGKDNLYNREDNSYCCLGVLCHSVFGMQNRELNETYIREHMIPEEYETYNLSGITECTRGGLSHKLSSMNDGDDTGRSQSFEEIANYIEQNVETY